MDKTVKRWDWLPAQMPGIARLIADKRRELGRAHVDECWRRGVVGLEPGWFFAREGALSVGVAWPDAAQALADFAASGAGPAHPVLVLAPVDGHAVGLGAADGAH